MSYEGVKYRTILKNYLLPSDDRIEELRKWCVIFNEKDLAPFYQGGTHGNMSFRLKPGEPAFIITAARTSFAEKLSNDSFFTIWDVDLQNNIVSASGDKKREPSSETLLHFSIYNARPDVQAILHGHCTSITENTDKMGIPTTKKTVESGTTLIVDSVIEILSNHSFLEIRNHGFMSMAESIEEAGKLAMEMLTRSSEVDL